MIKNSILDLIVIPKSSKSKISIEGNDNIRVYLNSPPADGKANKELINILSKKLNIAKFKIRIINGEKGRKKRLSVQDLSKEEVIKLLQG